MNREEFFDRWSQLHGNAAITGIVRWWLSISFRIASFLRAIKVSANGLTLIGVLLAASLNFALLDDGDERVTPLIVALLLLVISLAADGVDGSLALITATASRRGAALDAIADRVVESLWAYAFIQLGASPFVVIFAWLLAHSQEYIRARLGGLGIGDIGVVSIAERPVRASFLAIALVIALIFALLGSNELLSLEVSAALTTAASLWLIFQAIGFWQVGRYAVRSTIGSR